MGFLETNQSSYLTARAIAERTGESIEQVMARKAVTAAAAPALLPTITGRTAKEEESLRAP